MVALHAVFGRQQVLLLELILVFDNSYISLPGLFNQMHALQFVLIDPLLQRLCLLELLPNVQLFFLAVQKCQVLLDVIGRCILICRNRPTMVFLLFSL